ncbi:MAG: hypothetical protein K2P94_17220 [Rhodospirillaceae bacterium]|nr:hypothetical protein [Rhodospirillaceae bacterium]
MVRAKMEDDNFRQRVLREFECASAGILKGNTYFDQLLIWTRERIPSEVFKKVAKLAGKFHPHRAKPENKFHMKRLGWTWAYRLYQPSMEALQTLADGLEGGTLINYLEISIEIEMQGAEAKCALTSFLERHIWQGHRSPGPLPVEYQGTVYTSARDSRNNIVMYADRPSKISGHKECIKLEYRVRESRGCALKGVKTLADLINFDHKTFWSKQLRLGAVDLNRLELALRNSSRPIKLRKLPKLYRPFPKANFLCNIAIARAWADGGPGSDSRMRTNGSARMFQDVKAAWPHLSKLHRSIAPLQRYMVRIPNGGLLARVIT